MSKHTKGPWLVNGDQVEVSAEHNDGYRVCDVFRPDYKANALLIAAAPDLLEALKVCATLINIQNGNLHQDVNAILDMAKAAVDKAEGRS